MVCGAVLVATWRAASSFLRYRVAQWHPRKCPTVGAGSSQREDSPARPLPIPSIPCPPTACLYTHRPACVALGVAFSPRDSPPVLSSYRAYHARPPRACIPSVPSAPPLACILSPIFPNFARGFWRGRIRQSFVPYDRNRASPSSAPTAPVVGPAAAADGWACVWAYAGGGAGFPGVATTRCPCALPPSRHAGVCSCQRPA